jgi:hypothetical protein
MACDGDDDLDEAAVADDPSELLFGAERAGGGLARAHVAVCQRLASRWV